MDAKLDHQRSRESFHDEAMKMPYYSGDKLVRLVKSNFRGKILEFSGLAIGLSHIEFPQKKIRHVLLRNCIVLGANFEGFDISNCSFESCVFISPNFHKARMKYVNFEDVIFVGDTGDQRKKSSPHAPGSFERAGFQHCHLTDVTMKDIRARKMWMNRVDLEFCEFPDSRLEGTNILNSWVIGCDFTGTGITEYTLGNDCTEEGSTF